MAKIIPFKAVRPIRSKACLIASRPYYTYKKSLLKAKLRGNPYTFLHVINPELSTGDKTLPNSIERFEKVNEKYNEFQNAGFFIKESSSCLYIYRQTTNQGVYTGIIAGASIDDYVENKIKKHENTLEKREQVFKKYLDICQFHAEPVLLAYEEPKSIKKIINKITSNRPEYEFFTTDEKGHELWIIENEKDIKHVINEFKKVPKSYIADGHHRASSSLLYSLDKNSTKNQLKDFFLAYFIDANNLNIFEFNRFIKSIHPLSIEKLFLALEKTFLISQTTRKNQKPTSKKEITIYIKKKWYLLKIKDSIYNQLEFKKQLNSELVSEFILKPILNISDLRTDERVDFISGFSSIKELTKKVNDNPESMGICLFPHNFNEIKKIADKDMTMPPKSTWIEPKLRSALTIYEY